MKYPEYLLKEEIHLKEHKSVWAPSVKCSLAIIKKIFFLGVPSLTNISKFISLSKVEPSTKLFPAAFAQATSPNVFQFELGRIKVRKIHCWYSVWGLPLRE